MDSTCTLKSKANGGFTGCARPAMSSISMWRITSNGRLHKMTKDEAERIAEQITRTIPRVMASLVYDRSVEGVDDDDDDHTQDDKDQGDQCLTIVVRRLVPSRVMNGSGICLS